MLAVLGAAKREGNDGGGLHRAGEARTPDEGEAVFAGMASRRHYVRRGGLELLQSFGTELAERTSACARRKCRHQSRAMA